MTRKDLCFCFSLVSLPMMILSLTSPTYAQDHRVDVQKLKTMIDKAKYEEVIKLTSPLQAAAPNSKIQFYRGLAYSGLAKFPKAVKEFSDAILSDPSNPDYYFHRGLAFTKNGQVHEAV
ncbi:MAG: tetratricopeptide repeat protein [Deltaproteobacteria bacterium]|nr:tetratricopeptide repeat protein [Deltaproteobacteria bacterium]